MPTPERTSLAAIVDAGRALLDEGGPDALTMQAVAARVGVRAPSLYKRVRNREHLLGLVVDAVAVELGDRLAQADAPVAASADASTRAAARVGALARALRAWALANPAAYGLLFAAPERDLGSMGALRAASGSVLDVAADLVGPDRALPFARTVTAWATGFLAMELGGGFRLGEGVDEAFDFGVELLAGAGAGAAGAAARTAGSAS
ncbi:TetR/AcrR family transcriptional regulator [Agromyces sp. MMS24-K17]|uniref:TetR/AcrR family transcriptional regulator n=1 Tax=Agromyces sp. MMS24-K17 TaxID=3372850 RepID=UPI0037552151